MSQLKIPLISFCVAFVVFALLALFSGSSWLGIIFKASVSALVIAGFAFLAKMLFVKYIPEVFENTDKVDSPDAPVVGTNLDIRIGDEQLQASKAQENAGDLANPKFAGDNKDDVNITGQENSIEDSPFEGDVLLESPSPEESATKDDRKTSQVNFTPTVFAKVSPISNQKDSNQKEDKGKNEATDNSDKGNDVTSVPENASNTGLEQKILNAELDESIEKDVDKLEELPDLQEFVDSSNFGGNESKAEELMNTGTQSFFASDVGESVTDSKLMANAIRTVLKRES